MIKSQATTGISAGLFSLHGVNQNEKIKDHGCYMDFPLEDNRNTTVSELVDPNKA